MNPWYASTYTGLFTRFGPLPTRPHDPRLSLHAGISGPWAAHLGEREAGGIGLDDAAAEAACVGEAIERLQPYPLPDDQLVVASYGGWPLDEPAVAPGSWVLFHSEQYEQPGFPFRPLTAATECAWVCCRQAVTGLPYWVPAELVYLYPRAGAGHAICPGVSTGLACGRMGDPIVLRGLQEVIERDAVTGAWWGRYAIEEYARRDVLAHLRRRLERPNLTYRCYRVASPYSDHVTMVTLEGEDHEGYCFSAGSACREGRRASWTKAALEAVHSRHYVRHLKRRLTRGELSLAPQPANFAEHALYYSLHPDEQARTVLARPAAPSASAAADEGLHTLIERLGPGRPVLLRGMTPPALATEGIDWHVLRVVVPGLQPLHGNHLLPHLGGPLWSPRGWAEWSAMPPHPFP